MKELDQEETSALAGFESWLKGMLATIPWRELARAAGGGFGVRELSRLPPLVAPDEVALARLLAGHGARMVAAGRAHGDRLARELRRRFGGRRLADYPEFDFDYHENPRLIPEKAVATMESRALVLAGDVTGKVSADVKGVVIRFLVGSYGREEAQARIEEVARSTRDRASLIVTTETTYAYNRGRLASFVENQVDYVRFSAIMDARTSAQCRSRHGLIMAVDDPRLAMNTPPLHGRCRSVLSPVYSRYQPGLINDDNLNWDNVAPLPKGWRTAA